MNNKAVSGMIAVLIIIVMAFVGFGLIMFVFVGKAPDEIKNVFESEACRTSNEINYGLSIDGKKLLPSACETGPLISFPTKKDGTLEDVKKDIGEGIARCWYDWLEGEDKDLFGKLLTDMGVSDGERCFVCSHFGVASNDDIQQQDVITHSDLFRYLDTTLFSAYVPLSERTSEGKSVCEKRGGYCLEGTPGAYEGDPVKAITKWKCSNVGHTCYVKEKYITTYMAYLEGKSEGGGYGYLALLPPKEGRTTRQEITPGKPYAIAIVNPDKTFPGLAMDTILGAYSKQYPYILVTEDDEQFKQTCKRQFGFTEVEL